MRPLVDSNLIEPARTDRSWRLPVLKRLLLLAAMGVALAACGPGASPTTPAGVDSPAASDSALPSGSDMIDVSPSPSQ